MTKISMIVAYSRNRVIGKDNHLPWRLPSDLAHFKRHTLGKPIIMGRKTWESLGRPLPGRLNIVVSRAGQGDFTGATLAHSLEDAVAATGSEQEAFLIGGAQLYAEAMPMADRIIATEIAAHVEGDAFFPMLNEGEWAEAHREPQPAENGFSYDFVEYVRKAR